MKTGNLLHLQSVSLPLGVNLLTRTASVTAQVHVGAAAAHKAFKASKMKKAIATARSNAAHNESRSGKVVHTCTWRFKAVDTAAGLD